MWQQELLKLRSKVRDETHDGAQFVQGSIVLDWIDDLFANPTQFDSLYLTSGGHIDVAVYSGNLDTAEPDGWLRIKRESDGRVTSSWQPREFELPKDWEIFVAMLEQQILHGMGTPFLDKEFSDLAKESDD